ncbi:hypothetical protein [Chryseoglobus sp. 28M-23]|uniref:hypothetical protein n=1 Tax=Chryseoglobus sp. 28M-23 TaxID=2772253 RepID=UPI001747328A|nr:hypothetical protein [Chryseoglobus sp. 28M-23]QOD93522.1 hypothetical protein IE160_11575 [Chryseoglobus sp. 28M-23]
MSSSSEEEVSGLPVNQIDEVDLRAIGESLIELSDRLNAAGARISTRFLLDPSGEYMKNEHEEMTPSEISDSNAQTRSQFRSVLRALRTFRREYDRWERLTAEFALTRMGYSQREAAQELGVAASTINRWAQHPLKIEDYRNAE